MWPLLEWGSTGKRQRHVRALAKNLLKLWPALWTFADVPDVEPTNNAAERGLRAAVIYRKLSLGSRSDAELIRRRAAGEPLRDIASDYQVAHTTLLRYFERPEVAKEVRQVAKELRAAQKVVADRRVAERRLEQEVRRRAREQAARERADARHTRALVAESSSPLRRPRDPQRGLARRARCTTPAAHPSGSAQPQRRDRCRCRRRRWRYGGCDRRHRVAYPRQRRQCDRPVDPQASARTTCSSRRSLRPRRKEGPP
jgi:Transposase IS66 family